MIDSRPLGRTGIPLTILGCGTGMLARPERGDAAEAAAAATLEAAWAAGVRYFDTAPLYGLGRGEGRLGAFLATRPRDAYAVSTKVGRLLTEDGFAYDYSFDGAMRSLEASLVRLSLDRVDVALVHDIDRYTHGDEQPRRQAEALDGALKALLRLREEGTVRAVGLGVNNWEVCRAVAERTDVDCFLLAGRYTLLEQGAARELLPLCRARGIGLIIGGPHNSGILASGSAGAGTYNYAVAPEAVRERVRRIEAVLAPHGVTLSAAALQFPLLEPAVATVLPGPATPEEARAAAAALTVPIPAAVWRDLRAASLLEPEVLIRAEAVNRKAPAVSWIVSVV